MTPLPADINANFTTMMIRLNSRLEQYRTQLAGIDAYLKRNKVSATQCLLWNPALALSAAHGACPGAGFAGVEGREQTGETTLCPREPHRRRVRQGAAGKLAAVAAER
eukprot:1595886-Prymnesium_polylepis.1